MKKTFSLVLTLALTVAIAVGAATTAFACGMSHTDEGYVTMDTVFHDYRDVRVTVGDLFWTGSIGSAESSGTLDFYDDSVTWTLKDGVLILTAHPEKGKYNEALVSACINRNSPFWNNEHIETIVIDGDVDRIGAMFSFGLPNLKNVIFLGSTLFSVVHTFGMYGTISTAASFPIDHEINYVWEKCNDGAGVVNNLYGYTVADKIYPSAVGTSVDAYTFETYNNIFDVNERAAYLAVAAPIVANATLTQEAIDMLPADMIAAVNAIGGFKALGGNPLTAEQAIQAEGINVTVNGTPVVWTDAYPFVDQNNRTMVPLRAVADAMGLTVEWSAEENAAKFSSRPDKYIWFKVNSTEVYGVMNDGPIIMDTVPVIRNNRTYAPIRYLAEYFGYTVDWDGTTQTVIITS